MIKHMLWKGAWIEIQFSVYDCSLFCYDAKPFPEHFLYVYAAVL